MKPGIDLQGRRVLVVGLARTGLASSLFCASRGARVTATDQKAETELGDVAANLRDAGVALALGGHERAELAKQDLLVVSPGVPVDVPLLQQARAAGVPVWGEIELAWRFLHGKLVAITGSNGKTTTTSLAAHILKTAGVPMLVGGNIGTPLISLVEQSTDATVTVAEISSFQLETIAAFRPDIGMLLNVTPDHLDRHPSFEAYAAAKMRMFENQTESDVAILNADDAEAARRKPARPRVVRFSRKQPVAAGAFATSEAILFRDGSLETELARRADITLRGEHNLENVLAACAGAYLAGASPSAIAEGVRTFARVEHRLEFVAEIRGVSFYNDSKATNVDAALKAIEAFPPPQTAGSGRLLVILGGKDKGSPYTPLAEPLKARARLVLLIGAASEKIATDLLGAVPLEHAVTIERAVQSAVREAKPGDTVLLAPACSSFDQFENYEQRGRIFKDLVAKLAAQNVAVPAASTQIKR